MLVKTCYSHHSGHKALDGELSVMRSNFVCVLRCMGSSYSFYTRRDQESTFHLMSYINVGHQYFCYSIWIVNKTSVSSLENTV